MPPVLHVAFGELAARAQQQLLAQHRGLGVHERHRVLQLVAEAERAARLVEAAARPHPAGDRLVEQPAVGQHVERRRRACAPARRRACAASAPAPRRAPAAARGAAEALHQLPRLVGAAAHAEPEDDLARLAGQRGRAAPGSRRTDRAPRRSGPTGACARSAAGCAQRAVAAEELGAVAGEAAGAARVSSTSRKPTQSAKSLLYGLRANSAPLSRVDAR